MTKYTLINGKILCNQCLSVETFTKDEYKMHLIEEHETEAYIEEQVQKVINNIVDQFNEKLFQFLNEQFKGDIKTMKNFVMSINEILASCINK